jgi:hypothetical protein
MYGRMNTAQVPAYPFVRVGGRYPDHVVVGVEGEPELLEVVLALGPGGGLADLLDGRQEQPDQDGNDGDHLCPTRWFSRRRAVSVSVALAAAALAGCGGERLYPIRGTLAWPDGAPATELANGVVVFQFLADPAAPAPRGRSRPTAASG